MIELGQEAKDKITGFKGVITSRLTFLYGCDQYGISPKANEAGEIKLTEYFDEGRLEITGRGILPEEVQVEKNGGTSRDVPRGRF